MIHTLWEFVCLILVNTQVDRSSCCLELYRGKARDAVRERAYTANLAFNVKLKSLSGA